MSKKVYYVCVNGVPRGKLYQRMTWAISAAKAAKATYPNYPIVVRTYDLTPVMDIPVAPV